MISGLGLFIISGIMQYKMETVPKTPHISEIKL